MTIMSEKKQTMVSSLMVKQSLRRYALVFMALLLFFQSNTEAFQPGPMNPALHRITPVTSTTATTTVLMAERRQPRRNMKKVCAWCAFCKGEMLLSFLASSTRLLLADRKLTNTNYLFSLVSVHERSTLLYCIALHCTVLYPHFCAIILFDVYWETHSQHECQNELPQRRSRRQKDQLVQQRDDFPWETAETKSLVSFISKEAGEDYWIDDEEIEAEKARKQAIQNRKVRNMSWFVGRSGALFVCVCCVCMRLLVNNRMLTDNWAHLHTHCFFLRIGEI